MKTVKEISKITGVSIRTLRYYDEIGLLKPAKLTQAGYRLYDTKALEKLQQIMFFRELEIPLCEIKRMMENTNYDKEQVLLAQKRLLEIKRNRLNGIIELITDVVKGVNTMNFEAFHDEDVTKMISIMQENLTKEQFDEFLEKYGNGSIDHYHEIILKALQNEKISTDMLKWYGSKDKVIKAAKPIENVEAERMDHHEIYIELSNLKRSQDVETERVLIERLEKSYKSLLHLGNARSFLVDLAKEYLQDTKFAETTDSQYGEGTARYIAEAIKRYYGV